MKFGVREICDVVLKAKATQVVGDKTFYRGEPVCYFDTLKTSSMEGAATTVYAQGGRGNARLMAWDGERTVTFTMEDALISPEGFMILSGAGLIKAGAGHSVIQHITEVVTVDATDPAAEAAELGGKAQTASLTVTVSETPYKGDNADENNIYVMLMKNGEIVSEPYIANVKSDKTLIVQDKNPIVHAAAEGEGYKVVKSPNSAEGKVFPEYDAALVDYYTARQSDAQQINITPDKFGGNYYLEASTLFRDTNGVDYPAEFIIPNCKIQSNFTFTMASSGDPSTFTFTMDAFPDYTKYDRTEKVLASIQIINKVKADSQYRQSTYHDPAVGTALNLAPAEEKKN